MLADREAISATTDVRAPADLAAQAPADVAGRADDNGPITAGLADVAHARARLGWLRQRFCRGQLPVLGHLLVRPRFLVPDGPQDQAGGSDLTEPDPAESTAHDTSAHAEPEPTQTGHTQTGPSWAEPTPPAEPGPVDVRGPTACGPAARGLPDDRTASPAHEAPWVLVQSWPAPSLLVGRCLNDAGHPALSYLRMGRTISVDAGLVVDWAVVDASGGIVEGGWSRHLRRLPALPVRLPAVAGLPDHANTPTT